MKRLPIGIEDFKELIDKDCYYVDKTSFITDIINEKVALYTRPRRFGKTLNMSMLYYFFSMKQKENAYLFNDMDIVTIFSNLINNAMESCAHSSEKKIYLNIHTENQNTSDIEPIVINGRLKTHKDNAKLHGIGMNSISRALSAYNGSLDWKYNKEQKIFSTTIIIQNLTA